MANRFFDNVRHQIATEGDGPIMLGPAPAGWRTYAEAGAVDGDEPTYRIDQGDDWETGRLVLADGVTTATRLVLESTNSNAPIELDGTAVLTCVLLASDFKKMGGKAVAMAVVFG